MNLDDNEIYKSFFCPITFEIMENPVLAADGHTYEKSAIEDWFAKGKSKSPITGVKLTNNNLIINYNLKSTISIYKANPALLNVINKKQIGIILYII